jgi:hypothetical protein
MGLEPYKARYTLQLTDWNERVFKRRGINYVIVPGETLSNDQAIVTGQVLDAHGRTYFGMSQLMNLIRMMKAGELNNEDVIYFEDMFQPGIESLPYIKSTVLIVLGFLFAVLLNPLILMISYMYGACLSLWAIMKRWLTHS